jgi:hypothetical protein
VTASRDPHWRARLVEVQDLCLVAHEVDEVARAVMHLVAVLTDEWDAWQTETGVLRQLVREAADLLTNPESRVVVAHWLHTAGALLDGIPQAGPRAREIEELRPIDPRD